MNSAYSITFNKICDKKFSKTPSIRDIIKYIAGLNHYLMDNDREFCYIFDTIALNNGYTIKTLPSYWSIGREIFRYKKENNLSAKEKTNQISLSIKLLDLKKYNIKIANSSGKKISTARIIDAIWNNYNYAFENDRLLVKVFDCIAINNGYKSEELPKYWNIIRAAFDYKKDKELIKQNKTVNYTINESNKGIPIDYRVLEVSVDKLDIEQKLKNKLKSIGLKSINDILSVNSEFYKENHINEFKKAEIYATLTKYNIKLDIKYIPSVITLPDIYFKKLDRIFDAEIMQILDKYRIRNVGLLANKFPDILINDEQLMENPKVFEYIDKITNILNKYGISDCPINLSAFQIEDLNKLTTDELLEINYADKIIECINQAFCGLSIKEQDVLSARNGLYNEFKAKFKNIPDEILSTIDSMFSDDNIEYKQAPEKKNLFVENKKYTLDEIGQEFGVTRERIRQIEDKALKNFNKGFQDLFQKYYEALSQLFSDKRKYLIIKEFDKLLKYKSLIDVICKTYENIPFYIDFSIGLLIKEGILLEDLLDDDSVATDLKVKIEKFVYKDFIKINNHRFKNTKNDILIYFLRTHCRKGIKFNDFQNSYMDFLISNGLNDRDDLLYFDNTLYNKLSVMDCLLLSPGKFLRYYDVELAKDLVKKLDLSSYKDIEISSRKLYLENLELMQEYEIENEYELHNLLKKHLHNNYIDFSRMPIINFGTPNRDKQMEDLLYQLSPIKRRDFALAYEDKYGVDTKNFIANYAKSINKYLINGYYVIHTENLNNEHLEILKNKLTENFYWKEDLENIYTSLFKDDNLKILNAQNIKLLNYTMASSCIYSDKYNSLADCVEHIILNNNTFNLNAQSKFRSLAVFYQVFSKLKNNMDIIEFDSGNYINIKKLESIGIKKDDLTNYQKKVIDFIGDKFFTVTSLRNLGFEDNKLDDLGFDDYFYSSILINNPSIQYRKIQNTYLMKKGEEQFELSDFLIYIMGKLRKIDIYDLCDYIKTQYGLDINRYKIVAITKECSLYYNQITEKVYIDYDEFYNEI